MNRWRNVLMSTTWGTQRLRRASWAAAIFLSLAVFAPGLTAAERIVFLGDSITQAGDGPGGYITRCREAIKTSHPDAGFEVLGAGIGGNRVPDLQARLERDVLSKSPTVVVIYIGINDVWHSLQNRGTSPDDYRAGLKDVIARVQQRGARVILCTPSVIGEKTDGSNPLDKMLDEYSEISRRVAAEAHVSLLDLRKAFIEQLRQTNPQQQDRGILTSDGVHLNDAGNEFVAKQMLNGLAELSHHQKLLRHVVLFKFKDGTTDEQVKQIVAAFGELPKKIDAVVDFEWGTNNSPEGLADGFTHCFFVSFRSEEGRAQYLPHAAHQEFVSLLRPHLDKALVVDYWTN